MENENIGGWIITRDHLENKDVEIIGPRDCTTKASELLKGDKFELFDDDGELYYSGFMFNVEDEFSPLDDYGTPDSGCTLIKVNGRWL